MAAFIRTAHPAHDRCRPCLSRGSAGDFDALVASDSLAELDAARTGTPLRPRISPAVARRLVREDVEKHGQAVAMTIGD